MTTLEVRPDAPDRRVEPGRTRFPGRRAGSWCAYALVAAAVVWGLVSMRAITIGVPYLDDASMHEQMVRFATMQWRAGHLPLTSWFPYLGEGSPQFLHYQSLPAMITGAVGLVTGPDIAFRWSMYLLLASWPISVYLSARLFGARRGAAAASAAMAPFLVSNPGVGYEQHAYVWIGYGVWTQLWAMWTLPFAWGWSWRAIRDGRGYLWAVLFTGLTIALHFETGYLALTVLVIWPLATGRPFWLRVRRAATVLCGTLLATAWVTVPLLTQRDWASVNEPLQGTGLVNGYGAHQVLVWLVTGQLLDQGHLPFITVLAGVGFVLAWMTWGRNHDGRALLIALGICLLYAFGRTTFGSLTDIVPGAQDLFFRRFMMGIQLSGVLLAGRGAGWLVDAVLRLLRTRRRPVPIRYVAPVVALVAVIVLAPGWSHLDTYEHDNTEAVDAQRAADHVHGPQLDRLIAYIRVHGGGRTYAGMPSNWGAQFTVGQVPVFKYLESRDVDEVGYTLRTASLMTDPEYYFQQQNPSDYQLFGIRYLIYPTGEQPPIDAQRVMISGPYTLWTLPGDGYIQVGRVAGQITADRSNIGLRSLPLLRSGLAAQHAYLAVDYRPGGGAGERLPAPASTTDVGTVTAQHADLPRGTASATVHLTAPGVAVLSASFDPGWRATVNGRAEPVRMIAPALVAVDAPAGTDHVTFTYHGYGGYPELLGLAALTLLGLGVAPAWWRRSGQRPGRPILDRDGRRPDTA